MSPTTAEHVLADLGGHDIYVLQDQRPGGQGDARGREVEGDLVGIESTVVKIDWVGKEVSRSSATTLTGHDGPPIVCPMSPSVHGGCCSYDVFLRRLSFVLGP